MVWVAALLAAMLSVTQLYAGDLADGSLEQMLLVPGARIVDRGRQGGGALARSPACRWSSPRRCSACCSTCAGGDRRRSSLSLVLGTPVLSLLGGLGAALTLGLRSGAVLLILIIVPLCIPALIFGAGAVGGGRRRAVGARPLFAARRAS